MLMTEAEFHYPRAKEAASSPNVMLAFSIFNLILGTGCTARWQVAGLLQVLNDLLGYVTPLCQTGSVTEICEKMKGCL